MQESILIIDNNENKVQNKTIKSFKEKLPEYRMRHTGLEEFNSQKTELSSCAAVVVNLQRIHYENALNIISDISQCDTTLPIILWLDMGEEAFAEHALELGVYDCLFRPTHSQRFVLTVRHAAELCQMRRRLKFLEREVNNHQQMPANEWDDVIDRQTQNMLLDEEGEFKPLKSIEKDAIIGALHYANGSVTHAARSLGIGRSTLYRKVDEYDIVHHTRRENRTTRPNNSNSSSASGC